MKEILKRDIDLMLLNLNKGDSLYVLLSVLNQQYDNLNSSVSVLDYGLTKDHHNVILKDKNFLNISVSRNKFEFNVFGFDFILFIDDYLRDYEKIIVALFKGLYKIKIYKSSNEIIVYKEIIWKDIGLDKYNLKQKKTFFKKKIREISEVNGLVLVKNGSP